MAVAENGRVEFRVVADEPGSSVQAIKRIWVKPWTYSAGSESDRDRFSARSPYVETFWLSTLGPTTTWIVRRISLELEASSGGFWLDAVEWARWLGVSESTSLRSPLVSAVFRSIRFGVSRLVESSFVAGEEVWPAANPVAGPLQSVQSRSKSVDAGSCAVVPPIVVVLGQRPSPVLIDRLNRGSVVLEAKARLPLMATRQVKRLSPRLYEQHRRFEIG